MGSSAGLRTTTHTTMAYRLLTDLTIGIHFSFLVFVAFGGVAARRARWLLVPHLLALAWGVYVSVTPGLVCPLTPLENAFALRAGRAGYEGSFIEHYLVPIVYPEGLTPSAQWVLAAVVVVMNACVYMWPRTSVRRLPAASTPGRGSKSETATAD